MEPISHLDLIVRHPLVEAGVFPILLELIREGDGRDCLKEGKEG